MSPLSSCWSWCFLSVALAVNTRQTSSAPDFSDYLHRILKNHTAHACDGETLSIRCPTRTSVAVVSAFYGRRVPSPYLCPQANPNITEENTDCTSTTAIQKVMSECQDRRECQIPVVSPVFGQDLCPETSKYIIVSYKCKPEHHRSRTVCENERMKLACKNDTVLAIYSATFGHLEHDSLECPQEAKTTPDIECLSPSALRRVSRKCHGRTNCSVLADAQGFGDPCFPGTKKHLRVSFTCVPRYLLEDVGRGNIDPFLLSDYTHGLPETVALYFVSGICAGLFFLLCLFGLKSTLIRDLKDLASELGDELKSSHGTHGGLIDDFDDDDASLRSSFRHLARPYRTPDVFNPEMIMTVVMEERKDEDKPEMPNGDIWPHINSSPYAMHKIKTSSA
ncbi:protein eva-1 homolog C-like isoform X2 [Sinocyclocheilus anshuiensis]|uniref:protein eva-1 homolog C-like isoform X2 n=1 Tax=Sinocyclocheilus anshuiensis TaxID=1608454 RepID=UPI0007B9EA91|nr:PREDICTED: protein eva-1 homolog C-like isoform X2 [Sinocyclocheilus anshuiensis]